MKPTRRQAIGITGIGIVGLSGCISIPGGESESPNSSEETRNETEEYQAPETEEEEESEEEEPEEESANQVLTDRVKQIVDYSSWYSDEYPRLRSSYYQKLQDIIDLLNELDEKDTTNITTEEIDALVSTTREMTNITSEFSTYYDSNYPYSSLADEMDTDLKNALDRQEYSLFDDRIEEYSNTINALQTSNNIDDRYLEYVAIQKQYQWFMNITFAEAEEANRRDELPNQIYELIYEDEDDTKGYFASPYDLNYKQEPFGYDTRKQRFETAFGDFDERNTSIRDITNWIEASDRNNSLHMKVHNYAFIDSEYPEEFVYTEEREENGRYRDDMKIPNLNESNDIAIDVLIQEFDDETTAEQALNSILQRGEEDGGITHAGVEYTRVFYASEKYSETYYADITQLGKYIVAIDISETPWEEREYRSPLDGENQVLSVSDIISQSFLDIRNELSNNEE